MHQGYKNQHKMIETIFGMSLFYLAYYMFDRLSLFKTLYNSIEFNSI